MNYSINFTQNFKDDLALLSKPVLSKVNRYVQQIVENPYSRDLHRKALQQRAHTYRARLNPDYRMLYRVNDSAQVVIFYAVGRRNNIYDKIHSSDKKLDESQNNMILESLQGNQNPTEKQNEDEAYVELNDELEIEPVSWISKDDLYSLHIPFQYQEQVLRTNSVDELDQLSIPDKYKLIIIDYWTNPASTHIGKLYSLETNQSFESILQQPLSKFLIQLDPAQQTALKKIKDDGPYLIKGGAGTGKSLVGLYYIRNQLQNFDLKHLGIITFTHTLADVNREIIYSIIESKHQNRITCLPLDKKAAKLAKLAWPELQKPIGASDLSRLLSTEILPKLPAGAFERKLVERLSVSYLAQEFEQMITGYGITEKEEYFELQRKGREVRLRKDDRSAVWNLYCQLRKVCKRSNIETFEGCRLLALNYLKENPDYNRYDVLFVDEAQDFSKVGRQLCLELVKDSTKLILASDLGQSIYGTPPSWRQSDIRFDFQKRRPISLSRSYRSTIQLHNAIESLRVDIDEDDDQTDASIPAFTGPPPIWIDAALTEHPKIVANQIQDRIVNQSIQPGLICILIRENEPMKIYQNELHQLGIPSVIADSNTVFSVDEQAVRILTVHRSKGLEFPIVFVPELSETSYPPKRILDQTTDRKQKQELLQKERRLLYVALSRASQQLTILVDSDSPNRFTELLNRDTHWQYYQF